MVFTKEKREKEMLQQGPGGWRPKLSAIQALHPLVMPGIPW